MSPLPQYQIIAIQLSAGTNKRGYHHIEYVYIKPNLGYDPSWRRRSWLAEEIDAKRATAVVSVSNATVQVGVEHLNGQKYLRTYADSTVEDNLLHLPTYDAERLLLSQL